MKRNPHKTYCNYEITKANTPIRTVKVNVTRPGIRTSNLSKAMLAQQLAQLF